ncbi:invasin [Williamsia muralis]|uniref:Invasin n=1 Tax=Williamsia marianensis TaxID=85044 RepID=A0ABU4ETC3_WILMA|nr:invasin [Williamsia muralis]MDV7134498.1 invasin [Williamsia muralis]
MDVIINDAVLGVLAGDIEGIAAEVAEIAHPDVTAVVAAFMPDSPMVAATSTATDTLRGSLTVVSGQWESMASVVRATREGLSGVDELSALKFGGLGQLPTGDGPR